MYGIAAGLSSSSCFDIPQGWIVIWKHLQVNLFYPKVAYGQDICHSNREETSAEVS